MTKKRLPRKRAGNRIQENKRSRYLRLMAQGLNHSDACREVGINRRTGTRWRYGRTVTTNPGNTIYYPPISPNLEPKTLSDRYLNQTERVRIADGIKAGLTQRTIADQLGRNPSTISREIRRNTDPRTGSYTPFHAQQQSRRRRERPKRRKLQKQPELRKFVQAGLEQRWSPEQISRRLRCDFPDQREMRVAPETIYQTLYDRSTQCLSRSLAKRLRTGRTLRRSHRKDKRQHRGFLSPAVMIDQRPSDADDRKVVGHWEGDLIVGSHHQSAIGTLVERATRYTILVHINSPYTADEFRDSLIRVFEVLPAGLKRSLTWDQGVEMARHRGFTKGTEVPVFFCDRSSPWQRGTNENTNGLLRQYFPKHTDLGVYDADHLAEVAQELNSRPRKVLGWSSPSECVDRVLSSSGIATIP